MRSCVNAVASPPLLRACRNWNPTDEEQAIRRSYRIGQRRPVVVSRFVIRDSVEQRIVKLNEEKRSLASAVLDTKLSTDEMARILRQ